MRKLLIVLGLIAGFALGLQPAVAKDAAEPVKVEVTRHDGVWSARFTFPESAAHWAFQRSSLQRITQQPWRQESWRIATPGVRLERIGEFEVLVADGEAVPTQVEMQFTPFAKDLMADYDPAMVFSNGTVGLYTGHFFTFPIHERADLEALSRPRDYPSQIVLTDEGDAQLLYNGQRWNSVTTANEAYVLFGEAALVESALVATIFDPGLPAWLSEAMPGFNERTFAYYTSRLGEHTQARPTILASWAGPTPELMSMGGSVTGNMVAMRLEGEGLLEPRTEALERIEWFVAHEAAHFWLGQTVSHDDRRNAWISEGGADLMALRLMLRQPLPAESEMFEAIPNARQDCARSLADGGVQQAGDRLDHRANYACGMIFALAVEQAGKERGEDFFDFVALLASRYREQGIGSDEWLDSARDFGMAESDLLHIRALLHHGAKDGEAALARLLDS